MVTELRVGLAGVRILVVATDFSLLQNVQTGSGAHPASYSMGTGGYGKVLGCEVDLSPPSNAR